MRFSRVHVTRLLICNIDKRRQAATLGDSAHRYVAGLAQVYVRTHVALLTEGAIY